MRTTRALAAAIAVSLPFLVLLASPLEGARKRDFPHRKHLSEDAISGKSEQDCRVCHDYSKGERDRHLTGCDPCHQKGEKNLERNLLGPSPRPEFQHQQHVYAKDGSVRTDMRCATCHPMLVGDSRIDFGLPPSGLGPKTNGAGPKACADCHATHETSGGKVTQDDQVDALGGGKACSSCHLAKTSIEPRPHRADPRTASERTFEHADHGGAAKDVDCASCHASIKTSNDIWDYTPADATAARCKDCHVDEKGETLAVKSQATTTITRIDFSNFPHSKHLGKFTSMECRTCHYPETDAIGRKVFTKRVASPEPVPRAELVKFEACDACHGQDEWAPGKKAWSVKGHGAGGTAAWACFKCHDGRADAAGNLLIGEADVKRRSLGALKVAGHHHPGVTSKGAPLPDATDPVGGKPKACVECHVAGIDALSSRLLGQPFAHAPHLRETSNTDCLACHSSTAGSRRSEDLARFDIHAGAGPGAPAKACAECHAGASAADLGLLGPEQPPRKVPQFDHAGHIRHGSLVAGPKGLACTDCHTSGGLLGYTTPKDVLDCTKCHTHEGDPESEKVKRTGPKTTSKLEASQCLHCHEVVRGEENGRVRVVERKTITRSHLELRTGEQRHDRKGACDACHMRDEPGSGGAPAAPYVPRIEAGLKLSIHEDDAFANASFNDPKSDCMTCHRTKPRSFLRTLSGR